MAVGSQIVNWFGSGFTRVAMLCIRAYQITLSPLKRLLFGANAGCRFYPTCSHYALGAFGEHGFVRGSLLSFSRILRCNPFNAGGHDPVPQQFLWRRVWMPSKDLDGHNNG